MKKLIITLCSIGLMLNLAQAQPGDMPPPPPDIMPPEIETEIPEEIILLHGEVKAMRDALRESRRAALQDLGEEATREERKAALGEWRSENTEQLEEVRELTQELRELIRENRPDGPLVDVPEEIVALREELKTQRQSLAESRRSVLDGLGEDPTDEEVRAALDGWREANADAIAEARGLSDELRQWFRENRPDRPGAGMTPGIALRRAAFRENVREMRQNRVALRNQLQDPDLSEEERQQIIASFREQQRELMQERKALKRKQRIDQGGVGGDRRPGG